MATCTMAKVRSRGLLPTSLATRAPVIMFQSVTTSARAGATDSATATIPSSKAADDTFVADLMETSFVGTHEVASVRPTNLRGGVDRTSVWLTHRGGLCAATHSKLVPGIDVSGPRLGQSPCQTVLFKATRSRDRKDPTRCV